MSETSWQKPSEIIRISDEYTAFCFDEACSYILNKVKNGEEPNYEKKKRRVSRMADYFKELGV